MQWLHPHGLGCACNPTLQSWSVFHYLWMTFLSRTLSMLHSTPATTVLEPPPCFALIYITCPFSLCSHPVSILRRFLCRGLRFDVWHLIFSFICISFLSHLELCPELLFLKWCLNFAEVHQCQSIPIRENVFGQIPIRGMTSLSICVMSTTLINVLSSF